MAEIRENGFLNYFGEQRVGDAGERDEVGVRSCDIGKEIMKQDYKSVVNLIMTGRLLIRGKRTNSTDAWGRSRAAYVTNNSPQESLRIMASSNIPTSKQEFILMKVRGTGERGTLHYTLHYTTLHYTTLHYTTLHYTTLHYTTLHYTTLHYTTLHYTTSFTNINIHYKHHYARRSI